MTRFRILLLFVTCAAACSAADPTVFETSDRCLACHNGLTTPSGEDVSIGFEWRASIMANSSRDPYWQASVRRETIDHAPANAHIQDECSICHMPLTRYLAKLAGKEGQVFSHLPLGSDKDKENREAADGVDCSLCHQITAEKLGTRESFNGGFVLAPPGSANPRPEYGPFQIDKGQQRIMHSSTRDFEPTQNTDQIKKSELCATCHTLFTAALDANGKQVGELPEQMPYPEWLNSDYRNQKTCQDCHMPESPEPAPITRVFGAPREGMKRHQFVAANFFIQRMLNRYRDDLAVAALPEELSHAADRTVAFLKTQSAKVSIANARSVGGRLQADVTVENLSGHKLPTAYPSRRAWLHFVVTDSKGSVLFESGKVRADGSIVGNDNDEDAARFEPHYREIARADQVEIYEDIMGDPQNRVTTGILTGTHYLKDNRLLPKGFNKAAAEANIAVIGDAVNDPAFTGGSSRVRYSVPLNGASGSITVRVELWYQPIGFRWANNLKSYNNAAEPKRFTTWFDEMGSGTAEVLAESTTVIPE